MSFFPASLENLIEKFASLPGIGRKSAQRLAFHVLALPDEDALSFASAITDAKRSVHTCQVCQNLLHLCQRPAGSQHHLCGVRAPGCAQHRAGP